ncbi:Type I restriction-modification system, restriction subunit R, partial [hydrothermal vent metagenome]
MRKLEERIRLLEAEQNKSAERIKTAEALHEIEASKFKAEQERSQLMSEERAVWEDIAEEQEKKLTQLKEQNKSNNKGFYKTFFAQTDQDKAEYIGAIEKSSFEMSEAETRLIIDEQLRESGWEADTVNLRYSKGSQPEKTKFKAIAEWPTKTGPADYVLFNGLIPVAVVEAKKSAKNVYGAIDQAKRYASGIQQVEITEARGKLAQAEYKWGEYKMPLVFATNGRPYLKQLEQESGIWFLDVRDNTNARRALKGWY